MFVSLLINCFFSVSVGGLQRNGSVKGVKKVSPPTVPTLSVKAAHFKQRSPCICNGDEQLTLDLGDSDSDYGGTYNGKPPRSPANGTIALYFFLFNIYLSTLIVRADEGAAFVSLDHRFDSRPDL